MKEASFINALPHGEIVKMNKVKINKNNFVLLHYINFMHF